MSEGQCVAPEDENPVGNRLKYGELRNKRTVNVTSQRMVFVAVLFKRSYVQRRVFHRVRESPQGLVRSWKLGTSKQKKTLARSLHTIRGRRKCNKMAVLHGIQNYFCIACSAKYSKGLFPQSVRQFESDSACVRDMMSSTTSCAPG